VDFNAAITAYAVHDPLIFRLALRRLRPSARAAAEAWRATEPLGVAGERPATSGPSGRNRAHAEAGWLPCSAWGPRARCSCAGWLSISGARTCWAVRYQVE